MSITSSIRSSAVSSSRSKRGRKHYPIFEEFAENIDDPYWIKIFEDATNGRFPKGFLLQKNSLIYKQAGKVKDRILISSPSEIINFFKQHGGFRSDEDLKQDRENLDVYRGETKTRKATRQAVLYLYAHYLVKYYGPEEQTWEDIVTLINIHMLNKNIIEKDINYNDQGEILEIRGLAYNSGRMEISRSLKPTNSIIERYELRKPKIRSHLYKYEN